MTKAERARVESFLRDLARVCVAHGATLEDAMVTLPGRDAYNPIMLEAKDVNVATGSARAVARTGGDIIVKVDTTPPPF